MSPGFAREDLFTVVHEHFQTDTADYADIVLPATTQLEHFDVHKSYGHLYVLANKPAIAPLGEALPNTEVFRRLAARMGFDEPCFRDSDEDLPHRARQRARMKGIQWETLKKSGWQRLDGAGALRAVRGGRLPDAVGQVRVLQRARSKGHRPAADLHPPAESRRRTSSHERYPLAFISPPARTS